MKRALITGITGQDGSYLTELLLDKEYEVHGFIRRTSTDNTTRIKHLMDRITLHQGNMVDLDSLTRAVDQADPDEIYNLAAMSHVGASFQQDAYTNAVNYDAVVGLIDHIDGSDMRLYQASTSEMFGNAVKYPQDENTAMVPISPYGRAKALAHDAVRLARERGSLWACSGILFNHESPRRGDDFVTKKICNWCKENDSMHWKIGVSEPIQLGNVMTFRDWGHAKDYVRAMWMMLQQDKPDDYVIATGHARSVKEFFCTAYGKYLDFQDVDSPGWMAYDGSRIVAEGNPEFYRPAEVMQLAGNAKKAREQLGWVPEITFTQMLEEMLE